jgi:hypothetical protein
VAVLAATAWLRADETGSSPAAGRIHGTVITHAGSRSTGLIRWGGQEAFWDDLFQSAKLDLPYPVYAEPAEKPDEQRVVVAGAGRKLQAVDRGPADLRRPIRGHREARGGGTRGPGHVRSGTTWSTLRQRRRRDPDQIDDEPEDRDRGSVDVVGPRRPEPAPHRRPPAVGRSTLAAAVHRVHR